MGFLAASAVVSAMLIVPLLVLRAVVDYADYAEIKVVKNNDKVNYILLPAKPSELTVEFLRMTNDQPSRKRKGLIPCALITRITFYPSDRIC